MMTRDDIIRMAREAGFDLRMGQWCVSCEVNGTHEELERFAKLVAAAEREACAIALETEGGRWDGENFEIAGAIRARGEK